MLVLGMIKMQGEEGVVAVVVVDRLRCFVPFEGAQGACCDETLGRALDLH